MSNLLLYLLMQVEHSKKSIVEAAQVEEKDTPKRQYLKRQIVSLMNENSVKTKKIKLLNQTVKRQKKKIISLKTTIESLTEKNMINDDQAVILL